jgi:hypothetical protein
MHEHGHGHEPEGIYGVVAEFWSGADLLEAARAARAAGYERIEAYSPMPVEGLADAVGHRRNVIPLFALLGGIIGCAGAFALQWYSVAVAYPLNVGDRTPFWPGLVPNIFEMTVLGALLACFFGALRLCGLPRLNHPIFNAAGFGLAMRERFFLCVNAKDPKFDTPGTRQFLEQLNPLKVTDVDH